MVAFLYTVSFIAALVMGLALMRRGLHLRWRYLFSGIGIGLLIALFGGRLDLVDQSFFSDLRRRLLSSPPSPLPPEAYVAYNVPDTMILGRGKEIAFLIRGEYDEKELVAEIRRLTGDSSAVVETDTLPTTRRMSVRLAGGAFEIVPHSNETQLVEPSAAWLWEVYPREKGDEKLLTLTVSRLYDVDGRETPRDSQIVRREIVVRVGFLRAVGSFVQNNWFWLSPLVLLVGGYVGRGHLRRFVQKFRKPRPKLDDFDLVSPEETPASTDQVESG